MGKVIAGLAMSLDGFIADADDGVHSLFRWLNDGDTPLEIMGQKFMTSAVSAAHYREIMATTGASVTGRRDFDISRAWGGVYPMGIPVFIVTHHPPPEWTGPDSPFSFVTDGVESAIRQAQQAANGRNVSVNGSHIVRQALKAGLIDEFQIELVPVLLGGGVRLFEPLGIEPVELEIASVNENTGVTHLRYRVMKQAQERHT
jgi:dihydrofolate reductase